MEEFAKQIIIETTAFCTQKCIHCAHKSLKRKKGSMDTFLFKKIIDEISIKSPTSQVWMTYYGEALILKYKLFYLIRYAKDQGLTNVVLNTNAMLLDKEMSEMLINSGLDRLIISMDGFSKATYEKIRVGGRYETVFDNAINFLSLLKKQKQHSLQFEMQFSIMEENQHEVEAFNSFWTAQGAKVKNRPKASWAGRIEANNLDPTLKRIPCQWALNHGAILWDGSVVACGVDSEGLFVAGNINDTSFTEIWNTTHKAFRQKHLEHRWHDLPEVCQGCLDWQTTDRNYLSQEQH